MNYIFLQYKRGSNIWQSVSPSTRSQGFCGYQPYTSVSCRVRAKNSVDYSQAAEITKRTHCAGEWCFHLDNLLVLIIRFLGST